MASRGRPRSERKLEPGDTLTVRTHTDTPGFIMDYINQVREEEGNSALFRYMVAGIKEEMSQKGKGLFVPLPPDLTDEQRAKIENNEPLLNLMGNIIKSSVSIENPLEISLVSEQMPVKIEREEQINIDSKTAPIKEEDKIPKVNLGNVKKFSTLKKAFDD